MPPASTSTKEERNPYPILCLTDTLRPETCPQGTFSECEGVGHGPRVCATGAAAFCEEEEFDSDIGIPVIDRLGIKDPGLCAHSRESGPIRPDEHNVDLRRYIESLYAKTC